MSETSDEAQDAQGFLSRQPVPAGYRLSPGGTYAVATAGPRRRHADEERSTLIELADRPIWVSGKARDPDGKRWTLELSWLTDEGELQQQRIPASAINARQSSLIDDLAGAGVLVSPGAIAQFREYLFRAQRQPAVPLDLLLPKLGLQGQGGRHPIFVLPQEIIVAPGDRLPDVYARLQFAPDRQTPVLEGYRQVGSLADWLAEFDELGRHPMVGLGLLFGLCAPFAQIAGIGNGGVHLYGQSSVGKTTALQACASVAGEAADPEWLPSPSNLVQRWNATVNGMELQLAPHSGMAVQLDEIGSAPALYNFYQLCGGSSRTRMAADQSQQASATWHVQVLSSGEKSLSEYAQDLGATRLTAGVSVRMLDIPVEEFVERAQALSGQPQPAADVLADQVKRLKTRLAFTYGSALPAFMRALLQECVEADRTLPDAVREDVQVAHERLCQEVLDRGDVLADTQRRGLHRVALLAAIGQWAVEMQVVPFGLDTVYHVTRALRDTWLATEVNVSPDERVLRAVKAYAQAHFHDLSCGDAHAGAPAQGRPYFAVHARGLLAFSDDQLRRASGSSNLAAVGKVLDRAGWLHRDDPHRQRSSVPAELREQVPGGRLYLLHAQPLVGDLMALLAPPPIARDGEPRSDALAAQPRRRVP